MPRGPDGPYSDHWIRESRERRKPAFQRALASSQAQTPGRVNVPGLPVPKEDNLFCTARLFRCAGSGPAQSTVALTARAQANEFLDLLPRNGNLRQLPLGAASPPRRPGIGRIHCAAQYPFPYHCKPCFATEDAGKDKTKSRALKIPTLTSSRPRALDAHADVAGVGHHADL